MLIKKKLNKIRKYSKKHTGEEIIKEVDKESDNEIFNKKLRTKKEQIPRMKFYK
jgi:hypothetical protein